MIRNNDVGKGFKSSKYSFYLANAFVERGGILTNEDFWRNS